MKILGINSEKYGCFIIMYSDEDESLISKHKWNIHKNKAGAFYARTLSTGGHGKRQTISMHRLVMGFPNASVDHKNRYTLDNTRENLRIATTSQNQMNCNKQRGLYTCKFKGVSLYKNTGMYRVRITANGKIHYGGYFNDPKEAAKKYNELAIMHHGKFANLNKI